MAAADFVVAIPARYAASRLPGKPLRLLGGEPVVLHDGLLSSAIRASVSMPVFFQPHQRDGRYLVDGALCAPLPLDDLGRKRMRSAGPGPVRSPRGKFFP